MNYLQPNLKSEKPIFVTKIQEIISNNMYQKQENRKHVFYT